MKSNMMLWVVVLVIVLVGGYALLSRPTTTTPSSSVETESMTGSESPSPSLVTVQLSEQNDLGQSGTATIEENAEGKLVVTLAMVGGSFAAPQPAHIHLGSCPNPGAVEYPLTNVVGGTSVTTIDTTWAALELAGEALAINVHKSAAESSVYTACGDLPIASATTTEGTSSAPVNSGY